MDRWLLVASDVGSRGRTSERLVSMPSAGVTMLGVAWEFGCRFHGLHKMVVSPESNLSQSPYRVLRAGLYIELRQISNSLSVSHCPLSSK